MHESCIQKYIIKFNTQTNTYSHCPLTSLKYNPVYLPGAAFPCDIKSVSFSKFRLNNPVNNFPACARKTNDTQVAHCIVKRHHQSYLAIGKINIFKLNDNINLYQKKLCFVLQIFLNN